MKRLSFVVGVVGLLAFFAFLMFSSRDAGTVGVRNTAMLSREAVNDEIARERQEWLQLRNPYTMQIPVGIRSKELAYARTLPNVEEVAKSPLQKAQLLSWASRGPINQGGRTRALAYDISDVTGNTILAGGVSGGMWRSTDGGASWTRTSSLSDSVQSVTCLAQDPRVGHQSTWYYGTGELSGNSAGGGGQDAAYSGDGLYKSTDGGTSWQKLTNTASWTPQAFDKLFDYVRDVVVDPTNGNVYAAVYGEIDRSTDGGTTWSPSLGATSAYSASTDIAVSSTGVFYAVMSSDGSDGGIYRSTTGALNSWTNITPGSWPSSFDRTVLAIAPSNEDVVYFLSSTPNSGLHVENDWTSFFQYTYLSGDGSGVGGSWTNRTSNLPTRAVNGQVSGFSSQSGYDLVVKVKPDNANTVFIGGTNLYRSTDGFATSANTAWIGGYSTADDISTYANQHPDEHSLSFMPGSSGVLLSGNDGGISKTTNDTAATVSWTRLNNGYTTSQFYSVAMDMGTPGDQTLIGGMQDNGHMFTNSSSGTTPWVVLPFGGDGGITAISNGRSSYYICTQNGGLERLLLDANGNALDFAGIKPTGGSNFMFTTPYVLDPNNSDIMYLAAGSDLWRNSNLSAIPTANNGGPQDTTSINWSDLTNSSIAGRIITALGVSTSPANRLYVGTDSTLVFRVDGANSGNPTPTNITGSGFPAAGGAGAYVSCIAVNPRNADTAIVVFSNYNVLSLFLTGDGGTSWTSIGGNLEQNNDGSGNGPSCRWATILPKGSGVQVYVATSTGVYSTSNLNGMSTAWALEGATVIGNEVTAMVISRPSDGLVVAATHGNGIFGTQPVTGVLSTSNPVPRAFSLSQNYPNPFNPSTTLQYVVAKAGAVKLVVYDMTGRQVATLVDGAKSAGTYTAVWDGKSSNGLDAASGVYLCRFSASGFASAVKMLLLK